MSDLEDIEVWWKRLGCMRDPRIQTGEESAMCGEIKELRAALAERMNHLELLKKYMQHVKDCEGWSFLMHASTTPSMQYSVAFTEEELRELRRLAGEDNDE